MRKKIKVIFILGLLSLPIIGSLSARGGSGCHWEFNGMCRYNADAGVHVCALSSDPIVDTCT